MNKTLRDIQREVHQLAVDKGWWEGVDYEDPRTLSSMLMNAVAELAEAQEEVRKKGVAGLDVYRGDNNKPEGAAIELADTIIRCLDTLAGYGYDAELLITAKHRFNKTRSRRHGGKTM